MKKRKQGKTLKGDGFFDWGSLTLSDTKLIHEIAKRACERDKFLSDGTEFPPRLYDRGTTDLAMDLEICHVKHHRLRLSEMAETKDSFSFMHDIYMIVGSIDRKSYGWVGLGVPRFAEQENKKGN
jgi:hypothetical protein